MKIHVISMATFYGKLWTFTRGGSAPSLWRSPGPDPALWPGMNFIMGQGKEEKKNVENGGLIMVYTWFIYIYIYGLMGFYYGFIGMILWDTGILMDRTTLWYHQTWLARKSPNWMEVLVGKSLMHGPFSSTPCLMTGGLLVKLGTCSTFDGRCWPTRFDISV